MQTYVSVSPWTNSGEPSPSCQPWRLDWPGVWWRVCRVCVVSAWGSWTSTVSCSGPAHSLWEIASLKTLAPLPVIESMKSMLQPRKTSRQQSPQSLGNLEFIAKITRKVTGSNSWRERPPPLLTFHNRNCCWNASTSGNFFPPLVFRHSEPLQQPC